MREANTTPNRPLLKRLTQKSLKMNRKRTIVTIIGIILATALITAVATMAVTFQWSLVEYEKSVSGDFHYGFMDVPEEELEHIRQNRNVESYYETENIGYSLLEGGANVDKPYLFLVAMDDKAMTNSTVDLVDGRLPENEHEVVISKHVKTNGGVDYKVGDTLTLNIGLRQDSDGQTLWQSDSYIEGESLLPEQTEEYTVVGITQRLSYKVEDYSAPGYTVITHLEDDKESALSNPNNTRNIYARYTSWGLHHRSQVTAELMGVEPELMDKFMFHTEQLTEAEWNEVENLYQLKSNSYLMNYETLDFRESSLVMLYSVAFIVILIIVFTSVFCIRNSFAISITEKMKQYGMLASVGATPRQIKKNVFYEASVLGTIAIPVGLASGVFATWVVVEIIDRFLSGGLRFGLVFHTSGLAIIAGALIAGITIFLSAVYPAKRAAKVSPIAAMNGNEDVRIRGGEVQSPAWVKKLFGMGGTIAYKNMKRNRKKYRVSVISIAVSVTIFIALHSFIQTAFQSVNYYVNNGGYNMRIWLNDWSESETDIQKSIVENGVNQAAILRWSSMLVDPKSIPYTTEAMEYNQSEIEVSYTEIPVLSVGERAYKDYVKELGLNYETVMNQAILINESYTQMDGKYIAFDNTKYKKGDVVEGVFQKTYGTDEKGNPVDEEGKAMDMSNTETITIAAVTNQLPYSMERNYYPAGVLVVSDSCMDAHAPLGRGNYAEVRYDCEDPDEFQNILEQEYSIETSEISNLEQERRDQGSFCLVVAIFLYGFIAVISLIGITNIFNTITTSMELRSKEFAMLRSIGMTSREFEHMIRMESVFYGTKALVIGIALGWLLSYLIYYKMSDGIATGYQMPVIGILISITAVFLLLAGIMRYSIHKIRKQNIIETIRQDNV